MLGKVADLKSLAVAHRAVQRFELSDERFDERGLARAVDAEHTDAFARADTEIDAA